MGGLAPGIRKRTVSSYRSFLVSVLAIVVGAVVLHIIGARVPVMWGVHFYGFFAGGLLWLAVLLLVVGCGVVLLLQASVASRLAAVSERLSGPRLWGVVVAVVVAVTAIFWFARTTHTYLGDGNVLVLSLPAGQSFHERQPLTMALQQAIYLATRDAFSGGDANIEDVAQQAAAFGSVVAGFLFLIVSWFLSREIVRLGRSSRDEANTDEPITALMVWFLIIVQGYIQLFFGYVENYSFYTVGIALYLWLALRFLRGAAPIVFPGAALLLGLALHLSTAILVPSFVALVIVGVLDPKRRAKTLVDTGITIMAFVALHFLLASLSGGYSLASTLLEVTGVAVSRKQEGIANYMFSGLHYRDFLNEQLLIGPLGLWLLLPAVVAALMSRLRRHATAIFLILVAVTYVGASWVAGDSNLGYARNWDLLAPGALVFTSAAVGLFLMLGGIRAAWAALLCALLVSLFHTAPWIATNASADRALARLKTLPLGYGRTEVLVAQWYRREGNDAQQLFWLEEAVRTHEYNNNAQYLLALYHFEHGSYDIAVKAFSNAAKLRPDKALFRQYLVQSLFRLDRLPEAIEHLEFLIEKEPNKINNWILYSEALKRAGRPEDAQRAFEQTEPIYRAMLEADPQAYTTNLGYGWALYNLKRYDEALPYFEKSALLNPASADAVCYIGFTLRQLGREDEAATRFAECLELNPKHTDRADIESWLTHIGRPLGSSN